MKKLVSEQIRNDGGYYIKPLVKEANARLKQIGKQGKRATIVAKKTSLSLQFTFKDGNGNSQKNPGLGAIPMSANGVLEAEKIAQLVTNQLVANQFTWDWFNALIGKPASEQTKLLTCKEMVEQYKKHYFKQRKGNKNPDGNWYASCRYIEKVLGSSAKPISLALVKQVVEATENNSDTRKYTLNGLAAFLKYFDNTDYKQIIKGYKANNKIKRKTRNVPSDNRIMEVYQNGFKLKTHCRGDYVHRFSQWQFLYGLLATYGLRIHEAWNIANWDKPVILKNDDWVAIDVDGNEKIALTSDNEGKIIPAILDPNNKDYLLCIKHDTKTGYRMTMPVSPEGHNWIEEFNLLQPLNLPDIEKPLMKIGKHKTSRNCTHESCQWFRSHQYGFTPHDLRHAWNHRGHQLGITPKTLAVSLGHSITMNTTGYLRHESNEARIQSMKKDLSRERDRRSEIEILREESKNLKAQLEAVKRENELLKTKLQLNQAYKQSKGKR